MMWRAVEWTVVMGVLCWLFVKMWSDKPFDRRVRRKQQRRSTTKQANPVAAVEGEPAHLPKERIDASDPVPGSGNVSCEL